MAGNVTRRSFFRLATDSLVALPAVMGGFLAIDPEKALAVGVPYSSDIDGGAYGADTEVIAVNPYETGFLVVDMATGGKERVAGARVIVKSRYNNKQVEGVTDDDGTLVLNIGDLAENPNNLEMLDSYAFNGSIEVIPNSGDYREFKVLLTRIEGGRGYRIPSRKITDDKPYPVSVSFDEWDVLYTSDLSFEDDVSHDTDLNNKEGIRYFGLSPANKDDHTFVVIMKNLPSATAQVTMQLVERDSKRSILSRQVTARNGVAELRVAKKFLQEGSTDVLPEKKLLDVWATIDGVKYTFPIRLQVEKTVFPKPEAVQNKVAKPLVTGGNATDMSGVKVTLPPSAPLGKKDEFSMWLPEFPINVYVDPTGYFQLTMRTPSWGYVNDYGNPEDNGWKKFPRDAVTKQIEKKKEEWDSILSKAGNAYSGEYGFVRQIDFSSTFKAYGFFQFMAVAQWDPKEGWFSGNAVGQFTMAMDYALSENFLMGPVPVLIEFAFKLSLTFSLGPGFIVISDGRNLLDCVTDLSLYQWDYTNTGLTLTIVIAPSLSVGVGIKGVASISLRGSVALSIFIGITMKSADGKSNPHVILGYEYAADIVAQFFLWTYAWNVFSGEDPQLYDNWESEDLSGQFDQEAILNPLADKSLEEVLAEMKPVTDDMLSATAEFSNSEELVGQQESEPVFVLESQYTEETVMGDGTVIPSIIYTLKIEGQEDPNAQEFAAADAPVDEGGNPGAEALGLDVLAEGGENAVVTEGQQLAAMAEGMIAQSEDVAVTEQLAGAAMGMIAMDEESVPEQPEEDAEPSGDEDATPEEAPEDESSSVEGDGTESQPNDDSQPVYSPYAYDIPGDYEPIYVEDEDAGGLVAMAGSAPGVAGLGNNGGIMLTADVAILKNVFGNPRVEVVEVEGTIYVLRIASVLVAGKPRTRLIATVIGGKRPAGTRQVLDFKINPAMEGMLREDLCDYEFAPQVDKYAESHGMISIAAYRLEVAFVSGKRNTQNLAHAATDLVLSYVQFHHDKDNGFDKVLTSTSWPGSKVFDSESGLPYHCISNLDLTLDDSAFGQHISTITYLDRMGNNPEDVLSDTNVQPRLGIVFVPHSSSSVDNRFVVPDPAVIEQKAGKIEDLTAYELRFWPSVDGWYSFMIRGASETKYYVMKLGDSRANPTIDKITCAATMDDRCRFHAWKTVNETHGLSPIRTQQFLTCNEQGELCGAMIKDRWDRPVLEMWNVGPKDFGIISFGVWGDFIYWPEARDGAGGQTSNPETGEVIKLPPLDDCHLMAARLYEGTYSDPFIMADLPHNIDTIVSISGNRSVLEVVASELVDPDKDIATIWYMAVPFVRTATAIDCVPVNPFVAPGKPARFYITVRNDGNTFLKGCEVAVYDKNASFENPAAVAEVAFNMDTIRESAWNPKGDDGKLMDVTPDGSLAPGKTSVFLMEVMIPEGWSGRKDLSFVTQNCEVVDGMIVGAEDGDDSPYEILDYSVGPENGVSDFVLADECYWEAAFYDDAPVSVYGEGEVPGGNSGSGGASGGASSRGSASGATTGSKGGLARTGDTSNTALVAGMAAAGVALAAAGARMRQQEDDE